MAPDEESYFPSLETCLSGNAKLMYCCPSLSGNLLTLNRTWKSAFDALSEAAKYGSNTSLVAFVSCDSSVQLLIHSIHGFPKPSSKSKSGFETRTSAINVTPASHGHYNIDEIKDDASWLSKEVGLDEIEALRIVTIEWQNRPSDRLRGVLSDDERASIHEAVSTLGSSGPLNQFLRGSVEHEASKSFLSAASRRSRLLTLYLEERRSLLGLCEKLVSVALAHAAVLNMTKTDKVGKPPTADAGREIQNLGKSIFEQLTKGGTKDGLEQLVLSCIKAMQSRLESLESGNGWHTPNGENEDVDRNWVDTNIHELTSLSDLLLLNLRRSRQIPKSALVLAWFRMVSKYNFFCGFQAQSDKQAHLIPLLQHSAATTSVALLDPVTSTSYLLESHVRLQVEQDTDENFFYLFDRDNISDIQEIFLNLAGGCIPLASPAVFAWGIVLYTIRELGLLAKETREGQQVQKTIDQAVTSEHQQGRRLSSSSLGSTQQSIYEDVVEHARGLSKLEDPVGFLTQSATDGCHVFDVIASIAAAPSSSDPSILACSRNMALLDIIKVSFDSIGYTPEILTATLAILDRADHALDSSQTAQGFLEGDLATAFMSDDHLMTNIFDTSMARFPYEALPFLRLCTALAGARRPDDTTHPSIVERLLSMDSFTQVVRPGLAGYHTIREDENANLVSLEQSIDLCAPTDSMLLGGTTDMISEDDSYRIPSGAIGQVVSESRPTVIMWYHRYSALGLLGRWLQLYQSGQGAELMSQADPLDIVTTAIIQLFTSLMNATNQEEARSLLEEASNGLSRNSDIVLVVFEIFEQHIQSLRFKRVADGVLSVGAACVGFLTAVVSILPGRIWPLLARSSSVNLNGGGSLLVAIVSTEATTGAFNFLETSVQLYASLLEDAISRTISQGHLSKSRELKRTSPMTDSSAPSHVMTRLLCALTQAMAEVYDSLSSWQFKSITYQAHVRTKITQSFRSLLDYGYGVDDNENLAAKLTSVTSMAAPYILNFFRPESSSDPNLGAVLQVLAEGLQEQDPLHQENVSQAKVGEIDQTLWLCYDLVRGARLKHDVTFLERQLCQVFPVLIRLYGMHTRYRLPCLKVMSELVAIGSISESDSSSLLSFLGMGSSRSLLEMLSTLDMPFPNTDVYVAIWELLTALLSARQQWFAIYLLTGSSPKEKMKNIESETTSQSSAIRGKAFLTTALDELSHIESVELERATAMLSFVVRAQENWSWATSSLQSHPDFFAGIMSYAGKLSVTQDTKSQCYQYKIAALVADLSIVYLHYARSNRDYSIIKKMLPAFKWYTANAVENTTYNRSLHANLRKNFTAKYPQCDVLNFKKTAFSSPKYGETFFYDVEIAAKMLSFDSSWTGTARSPGFAHEFKLANINLSLVDSQLSLLRSFKALCIEHSAFFVRDREVQKLMAQIVRNCLAANSQSCPAEKIFESLFQDRIELAIGLLQRLVDVKARGSEFTTLLASAWETTRFRNGSYDAAVSHNDLNYFRSCLTTLLLCIQLHVEKHDKPQLPTPGQTSHTSTRSTVLEILSSVVAQGFGQVSNALYDQAESRRPGTTAAEDGSASEVGLRDFSLLLSILQSSLNLPILPQMVAQVSSVFTSSSIIDSTLRLYSWSHRLSPPDADPVYSSCALSFLVALSSLPPVAEELGIEGVLNRLATSRITLTLQAIPGGVSPFEPVRRPNQYPHQQRLYAVWSEGILPLCLNLLHSVGRPMAGEIASLLNQFPEQLARANNAFAYSASSKVSAAGAISLSLAAEATTLALISHVLSAYRTAGASAGVDSFEIPMLTRYDEPDNKKGLRADIEEALDRKTSLRSRLVATNEKELVWAKTTKTGGGAEVENVLEEKIVAELKNTLVCLKGDESGEEDS
jgi:nuclear pore complex protein Nup188